MIYTICVEIYRLGETNNIWIGVNLDLCSSERTACVDFLDKTGNAHNFDNRNGAIYELCWIGLANQWPYQSHGVTAPVRFDHFKDSHFNTNVSGSVAKERSRANQGVHWLDEFSRNTSKFF